MKNNRIRLTESQLNRVIRESVKRILRESVDNSTKKEVAKIVKQMGSKIEEWVASNEFYDVHNCNGFIFANEDEAYQYVANGDYHQNALDYVNGACPDEEWISMLIDSGVEKRKATNIIKNEDWESVVQIVLDNEGPEWFLSQYSGRVHDLSNGVLYY